MRKLLSIFAVLLLNAISVFSAPAVNPATCFNNYPWATTYPGQYWINAEKQAKISKQLFYALTDRANVVGVYTDPYTSFNMQLQCGSYTAKNYRATTPPQPESTNVVQLLLGEAAGIVSTNTWYDQQFYYPKTPNVGNEIIAGLYYPSVNKALCLEIDDTIAQLCPYYVPSSIYSTLEAFLSDSVSGGEPIQELPYYGDTGCIIWDLGEPWKTACNVNVITWWDDAQTLPKTTSWYIPAEYAFPYPSGSDMSHNDGMVGVFTLKAADLRAAIISQFKYAISDGVPCSDNLHWNYLMYSGNGWDSVVPPNMYSEQIPYGDYGNAGDAIMYAYLGTSMDNSWASSYIQSTMGTAGEISWREQTAPNGSILSTSNPSDWPDSGWQGGFNYHIYVEISLDGSLDPGDTLAFYGMDAGYESGGSAWENNGGFIMDLGGTEHSYDQSPSVSWNGHSPVSITFNWSGEGVYQEGEWIPPEPAGWYDETTTSDVITNSPGTTNIIYRFANMFAWTNTPAGINLGDVICHFYISGDYFETTNKNCSSINTYTNMITRYHSMYRTNLTDVTLTTNHVTTTTKVWHDEVPGYWRSWWASHDPVKKYPTSGLWEYYKDTELINYVESKMIAYEVRPNLSFVVKQSPDFLQARVYGLGWKIDERPAEGVLSLPEWEDSCLYQRPLVANGAAMEEGKIKYLGNGVMSDPSVDPLNMIYWSSSSATSTDKAYQELADSASRVFYGIRQCWYVLLYTYPKRDIDLPDPR